jgi:hypothetical protein
LAAACQVSRVGNTALSARDLTEEIDAPSSADQPEYPVG